jgi:glycosyltransferase involved in cell wall biosynthesis
MFLSAVIPTINRSTLSRSVYSILNQDFNSAEFEVIVVNDTGQPLLDSDWQHSACVQIITTQKRERSVARNTGTAIARGKYIYYLDDDDIMLPGAMQALWELAQISDASWLYGGYQVVDNHGNLLEEFHNDHTGNISAYLIAGESIPMQASLFHNEIFYSAGEFDPHLTSTQDRDLERRVSLLGNVSGTPALIARIRAGQENSSTNWSTTAEYDRIGREKSIDRPKSFARLWDSARGSSYLHGRVSRAYLASALWNMRRGNVFRAASRLVGFGAFSLPYIFSSEFWKGLRTRVQPLGKIKREYDPSGNELISISIVIFLLSLCILPAILLLLLK